MIFDFTTTLTAKKQLTGDVFLFTFTLQNSQKLEFTAGQYLLLKVGNNYRQYSIASPSTAHDWFELIVQIVPNGLASVFFDSLAVGGQALFRGPAGVFTLQSASAPKIFLATGTGIAPMRSMFHTAFLKDNIQDINDVKDRLLNLADPPIEPPTYQLFWGVKMCDDMYFEDELAHIKTQDSQFDYTICLSREKKVPDSLSETCRVGRMNDAVDEYIKKQRETLDHFEWYLCGGKEIVDSLREFIITRGVSPQKILFEKFT